MLLLLRHANAGDKSLWQGPDRIRPLSSAGRAEAAGLLVRLEDYPIERILSSPTVRCQQTVQPLAHDRHLPVETTAGLAVAAEPRTVLALLADPGSQGAVLCTHGEVIGQVLTLLAADGLEVDQPLVWPKGSTWVLDGVNRRLKVGRYLPPLPLTDALIMALQARWKTPAPGLPPRVQEGPWQPSHQDPDADGRPRNGTSAA